MPKTRKPKCPWCANPNAEEWSEQLCRAHQAEYEGVSIAELDRMEAEQGEEQFWAYH